MIILLAETKMVIGHSLEDAGESTHYFETSKFRYEKSLTLIPFPIGTVPPGKQIMRAISLSCYIPTDERE